MGSASQLGFAIDSRFASDSKTVIGLGFVFDSETAIGSGSEFLIAFD